MNPCLMPCRNSLALTKRAVESVLHQNVPTTLYLIDNESTDGTREWLSAEMLSFTVGEHYGSIRNWRFTPAKGVSASWNFGLDYLFNTAMCLYVLVVNNDVELRTDTYRELLRDCGSFVTAVSVDKVEQMHAVCVPSRRPN